MRPGALAILGLLLAASSAHAVITFNQLDDDVFVVSHRVKGFGSRGKANRLVYEKAASLCLAAGFTHYKVLHQESNAVQEEESANATIRVQFYFQDGEDRLACEATADPEYVEEAREKLLATGYRWPEPPAPTAAPRGGGTGLGSCTLEQIAAMARSGLSDDQIRAACP